MAVYSLVLSDDLQKTYQEFKENGNYDRDIVSRLFHYFKGDFLTNTAQMRRIGREPSPALQQQLRSAGYTTQTLEDLAKKTAFKIILSTEKNSFPYVNIYDDVIENNLTGCFYKGDSRTKAIEHIKALCLNANEICIYDKYLTSRGSAKAIQEMLEMLASLFSRKDMHITYHSAHLEEKDISFLRDICDKWIFEKRTNIPEHHDRYLIIDNKMEVILTSGFSSLSNLTKEFTYIVRPIIRNRFDS